jgi:hypothetical protein
MLKCCTCSWLPVNLPRRALSHGIEVQGKNNLEHWHDLLLKAVNSYSFQCQGELTVSSKPEAAFAFATVIKALCADFPDFGPLILGHFHRACPYLVPMYMPQLEGQSTEDYYK